VSVGGSGATLRTKPLTPDTWADFESVFNARGCSVARNCWCMYYRRSGRVAGAGVTNWPGRDANKSAMRRCVKDGEFIGLVGYRGAEPVGWISFGPREGYKKLERSPVMRAVDDERVWSVICFVVPKAHRGSGVARALLKAAIAFARKQRVKWLEAYPVDKRGQQADDSLWFGTRSMFDDAGFVEVARRKPTRPVMRLRLRR
jgi:GNAT superfamily N-acetyltransferase